MREIKFRAWDKKNKKMFSVRGLGWDEFMKLVMVQDQDRPSGYRWMDSKDIELMQFTGLHDKNGKEIFESDVVSLEENKALVEYSLCYWQPFTGYFPLDPKGWEVIGNIYENPELL